MEAARKRAALELAEAKFEQEAARRRAELDVAETKLEAVEVQVEIARQRAALERKKAEFEAEIEAGVALVITRYVFNAFDRAREEPAAVYTRPNMRFVEIKSPSPTQRTSDCPKWHVPILPLSAPNCRR